MRHVESLVRMSGITKRFNEDIKSRRGIDWCNEGFDLPGSIQAVFALTVTILFFTLRAMNLGLLSYRMTGDTITEWFMIL
jgi:hypothetical protein